MTAYQTRLYQGMLRLFRAYGTGGASWIPITGSGGGVSSAPTFSAGSALTLYVLEASLIRKQFTLPAVGIYAADWWGLPVSATVEIAPDVVLKSVATPTMGFLVAGVADTSQGFPVFPLRPEPVPVVASTGNNRVVVGGNQRVTVGGDNRVSV